MKSNKLFVKNNSIDIRVSFCVLLDHVFPLFRLAGKFDTQTHFQTFHSHLVIPDHYHQEDSFLLTTPE